MSFETIALSSPQRRTREVKDPLYPLLEANRSEIESIKRQTFTYGKSETHKLDVYYPPSGSGSQDDEAPEHFPILVFFYGGGFVHGSRSSPPSFLVHNNLGAFFASKGIITVIPDYRLMPGISFPQGSEDIRDALIWTTENLKSQGNTDHIFIFGHSAGGLHVAGCLLTPSLFTPIAPAIRGVIIMGTPCRIVPERQEFYSVACDYYGGKKGVTSRQPIGLLQSAERSYISRLPPMMNMRAASEPRPISSSIRAFTTDFANKGGNIQEYVLEGHDHLSPILSLSTGYGEEWGDKVIEWIKSH